MKNPLLLALALVLGGVGASAADPQPLYVKARNTHLKASSKPTAKTVRVLQPGDRVTFLGREPGTPWCRVTHTEGTKVSQGVIFQASLTATAPTRELSSQQGGAALDPQAFAASGAAVKALGPGVVDYGKDDPDLARHVKGLEALEGLAVTVNEAVIAQAVREKQLNPVVGSPATGGAR